MPYQRELCVIDILARLLLLNSSPETTTSSGSKKIRHFQWYFFDISAKEVIIHSSFQDMRRESGGESRKRVDHRVDPGGAQSGSLKRRSVAPHIPTRVAQR